MNVRRVIHALKKYSPHGLCNGTLIKENGDPSKTIGCTVGCLAVDAINAATLKKISRITIYSDDNGYESANNKHQVVECHLQNGDTINDESLSRLIHERFDITESVIADLIEYNDSIKANLNGEFNVYEHPEIPEEVRLLIYNLRLKYDKWIAAKDKRKLLKAKRLANKCCIKK